MADLSGKSNELPHVTITTDGAARGNPGPGGWAALLQFQRSDETIEKMVVGEEPSITTNNAMEVEAVIGGLAVLKRPCEVTIRIDSTYVIEGIKRLLAGHTLGTTIKNHDRWTRLQAALQPHTITLEWVRGHAGDTRNERVDEAANAAAQRAYDMVERQRKQNNPQTEINWVLAICSPGTSRPVRWVLRTPTEQRYGEIYVVGITEPTAVWQALVDGLTAAHELAQEEKIVIIVKSNYDLIIKQGRGEWKVKNPAQQPLAARMATLRGDFAELRFEFTKTEDVQQVLDTL